MNKKYLIISTILVLISSLSFADTSWDNNQSGTPTVFKVKPIQMWLCESYSLTTGVCTGDNIHNITSTVTADSGRCDIAAAPGTGAVACNMGSTASVPKGITYNYARMELDRTMWLSGTVTNSGSNADLASCHTDSSNVAASGYADEGSTGGTASTQALRFMSGPGNEDFQGNASVGTGNTTNTKWQSCYDSGGAGCSWSTVKFIDDNGGTAFNGSNDGSADYSQMNDYTVSASGGPVWQQGLADADTTMFMIYKLSTPFTRTLDTNPTIAMSFDVTDALDANFVKSTEGTDVVSGCMLYVGNPGVTVTFSD
jgi:hypothetical protein